MEGTKQYPPPGYTQVPTEPPPGNFPYPVQAGYNLQSGSSPMHQQYPQQPMYPQLEQHQQPPGSVYYAPVPTGQSVIVTQPQYAMGQPVIIQAQPQPERYIGAMVLATFTFVCCGVIVGFITLVMAVAAQIIARKHPNTARCLGRSSIAIAVIWIAITVLLVVLYFGLVVGMVGFSAQFSDIIHSLANNETLSAEDQDFIKAFGEVKCGEVSRMSAYERSRVTDTRALELMRKCDTLLTTTRRSTTSFY